VRCAVARVEVRPRKNTPPVSAWEKLLYLYPVLSRSPSGYINKLKPLLEPNAGFLLLKPPHGGFRSEAAVT
jgi:hypothetical protein